MVVAQWRGGGQKQVMVQEGGAVSAGRCRKAGRCRAGGAGGGGGMRAEARLLGLLADRLLAAHAARLLAAELELAAAEPLLPQADA